MAADIDDVARLAGVSTATVSRALRGFSNVSEKTRKKVLAAAAELDYVSSPSASRLASGRTHSVGIVAPYIGRWYFGQILSGAERVLREAGYDVLLFALPDAPAQERFFRDMPLRRRVDGVMVVSLPLNDSQVTALHDLNLPLASIGVPAPGFFSVGIDDVAAARTATNHLINLGHTRIACIGGGPSIPTAFEVPVRRLQGYREAMTAASLDVPEGYIVDGGYTASGGESGMAALMSQPHPPTAVFAQSDEMAAGALRALRRSGLDCPGDVSIIGFDDNEIAELLDLTTVRQPVALEGEKTAAELLRAMSAEGPSEEALETLPTELVLRASTTTPPGRTPPAADAGQQSPSRLPHPRGDNAAPAAYHRRLI